MDMNVSELHKKNNFYEIHALILHITVVLYALTCAERREELMLVQKMCSYSFSPGEV